MYLPFEIGKRKLTKLQPFKLRNFGEGEGGGGGGVGVGVANTG